jgi:UDP-N-acetylglucosamine 1-carboxyvinyltransferase
MRGSICVLGPLLARRGSAAVSLPGGCVIGDRPIDLHLKGLRALGARIQEEKTSVLAHADRLRGARMDLSGEHGSTVTGTANVMMAATLAEGRTIIERAAREPEVQDLCHYLVACGARISGIGSSTLIIDGVPELHGVEHKVVPDRIETGTLLVAAAATRGSITVDEARPEDMGAVLECLRQAGARVSINGRSIHLTTPDPLRGVDVATAPHPGLPTDMQPQLSTLLCTVSARSIIREEVYPKRTTHVEFLREMGAKIRVYESQLIVDEGGPLQGATVRAKDLRAGAALVIAGLAADGTTTVTGLDQIDRGYQDLAPRLRAIGAEIHRVDPQAGRRTA